MANWRARVDKPLRFQYKGLDVHKCSSWTQGPVFLQQLAILEQFDLQSMGHNSADYLHTWTECAKLAFADREVYYGDPDFDDPPFKKLLSKEYNEARAEMIGKKASNKMRPGDVGFGVPETDLFDVKADNLQFLQLEEDGGHTGDTTHLDAIDREGNMVSSTPSGGWIGSSPVIPGLGFPLGTRGQMFYLNPERPNALEPRKRPRATLTPSLVMKDGKPHMVFGTPGGDAQDQWTLQFFLNVVEFGMNLQEAIDAATVYSEHFPSSFYPRKARPGKLVAEDRIPAGVLKELKKRGHEIAPCDGWIHGRVSAIRIDEERGVIEGAASPRRGAAYAQGW